jgi:hypothetical protein
VDRVDREGKRRRAEERRGGERRKEEKEGRGEREEIDIVGWIERGATTEIWGVLHSFSQHSPACLCSPAHMQQRKFPNLVFAVQGYQEQRT